MQDQRRRHLPVITTILAAGIIAAAGAALLVRRLPVTALPAGWQIIRPPHEVSALAEQGDFIWAGGKEGVYRLERSSGKLMETLQADVPLRYVSALAVDRAGALWIGHNQGLTVYDRGSCRTLTTADGLPDNRINALLVDTGGRLWAGSWGGAAVREGDGWRVLTVGDGLIDNMVNVIFQDSGGGMWFGSYVSPRGGLTYINGGNRQNWNTESGLPHNSVTAIAEDSAGAIIVGTGFYERGGAAMLNRGGGPWTISRTWRKQDGLAGEKVRSVFLDGQGNTWFGSENDGIAILSRARWRVLTDEDGLAHNEIKQIMADSKGDIWIATRDGISRISAVAVRDVAGR